jgi:hypothetical protein
MIEPLSIGGGTTDQPKPTGDGEFAAAGDTHR